MPSIAPTPATPAAVAVAAPAPATPAPAAPVTATAATPTPAAATPVVAAATGAAATVAAPQPAPVMDVYNGSIEVGRMNSEDVIGKLSEIANAYDLRQSVSVDGHFLSKTVYYTWEGTNRNINDAYDRIDSWINSSGSW